MPSAPGLDILKERIDALPIYLRQTFVDPPAAGFSIQKARQVVVTGLGSSEAAARYLARLLNSWAPIPAEFLPLSAFYDTSIEPFPETHLIVFTQGLAPNAQIALAQRTLFSGLTLVTSSTEDGQKQSGKDDRAALLHQLKKEGAAIVWHPWENEYEILPRVIGPVCSMATALMMASSLSGREVKPDPILSCFEKTHFDPEEIDTLAEEILKGVDFYFTNRTSVYAQNLAAKVLETVFQPAPRIRDAFDYAHGPFQADKLNPRRRWLFTCENAAEKDLVNRIRPLFDRLGPARVIRSPIPEHHAVFYYEALLNAVVLRAIEKAGVDLVDWPGKGEDGEGYSISTPFNQ